MGIKIKQLIEETKRSIREFEGKIVALDGPNIVFRLFSFTYTRANRWETILTDRTQRAISHLYGLLYRVKYLYQKKILPIVCFDGLESELKGRYRVSYERFCREKEAYHDALEAGKLTKAKQIALGSSFFWKNTLEESKQLLRAMGVPVVISPSSAEAQCAELVKKGVADYSNSHDYDSLLYGCPRIVKNLHKSRKKKVPGQNRYYSTPIKVIALEHNLRKLRIDRFQLIDLALLIGVDYFDGVQGIGAKSAYNLIKKYKNLECVILHEQDNYAFHLNRERIQTLRELFLFPEVICPGKLAWNPPNEAKIYELLLENHTLSPKRVTTNSQKLYREFEACQAHFKKTQKKKISKTVQTSLF